MDEDLSLRGGSEMGCPPLRRCGVASDMDDSMDMSGQRYCIIVVERAARRTICIMIIRIDVIL